jgi:hypothetical protein
MWGMTWVREGRAVRVRRQLRTRRTSLFVAVAEIPVCFRLGSGELVSLCRSWRSCRSAISMRQVRCGGASGDENYVQWLNVEL